MDHNPKRKLFDYINATQFLPFCGIPLTAMTRHKIRGKDGNNKAVDFSADEWQKIEQGIKKLVKQFAGSGELTLQDLMDDRAWQWGNEFKLKNGNGLYSDVEATTGALVVIYRAGKGRGKDAKRWMPPTTPIELVPLKKNK